MRPTKNRVFCRDCNRPKMLFETERKALNFIKFNAEEMKEETGYAPTRAYFCEACGGWHVTSMESFDQTCLTHTQAVVQKYRRETEERRRIKKAKAQVNLNNQLLTCIEHRLDKVEASLAQGDIPLAKNYCFSIIDKLIKERTVIIDENRFERIIECLAVCVDRCQIAYSWLKQA